MKKILLIFLIIAFLKPASGQELWSFQVLSRNCDTLKLQVVTFFTFGYQATCPELSGYNIQSNGSTLTVDLFYDISGAWPQVGCWQADTLIYVLTALPSSIQITTNSMFYGDTTFAISDTTFSYCITGINDNIKQESTFVFPNPFQDLFFVRIPFTDYGKVKITIYDWLGREVNGRIIVKENETEIDGRNFRNGIYTISFWDDKGLIGNAEFIRMK